MRTSTITIALSFLLGIAACAEDTTNAIINKPPNPQDESKAWEQLDVSSVEAIQGYLSTYPNSTNVVPAQFALELQKVVASVKRGEAKPKIVIPFDGLGRHWARSKSASVDYTLLGILARPQVNENNRYFVFSPIAHRDIRIKLIHGSRMRSKTEFAISLPVPFFPTRHGSIIAYNTGGTKLGMMVQSCWVEYNGKIRLGYYFDNGIATLMDDQNLNSDDFKKISEKYFIETTGEAPAYFGVVEGVGLVHLKGKCKVTMADGKVVEGE